MPPTIDAEATMAPRPRDEDDRAPARPADASAGRRPMRPWLAALVLAGASTSVADAAAILGAGPGYAQPGSKVIECWLNNAGNQNVTISSMKIIREDSGAILPSYECKGNLPGLRSCYTYAFVEDNAAYACKVVVSDRTNVRGSLQITDSHAVVLYSEPLR